MQKCFEDSEELSPLLNHLLQSQGSGWTVRAGPVLLACAGSDTLSRRCWDLTRPISLSMSRWEMGKPFHRN